MMYHRPKSLGKVVQSINLEQDHLCVDFFQRTDNSFGYEEYRQDVETKEGWFPIGHYSGKVFTTFEAARNDAIVRIHWLSGEIK